jgi:hypothetical protein
MSSHLNFLMMYEGEFLLDGMTPGDVVSFKFPNDVRRGVVDFTFLLDGMTPGAP